MYTGIEKPNLIVSDLTYNIIRLSDIYDIQKNE